MGSVHVAEAGRHSPQPESRLHPKGQNRRGSIYCRIGFLFGQPDLDENVTMAKRPAHLIYGVEDRPPVLAVILNQIFRSWDVIRNKETA
jgi:hypothetical protein